MAKIKLVYQDCALCGARKEWGEKQLAKANTAGLEVELVSFASPEGSHLCKEAVLAGIGRLPFFTDGLTFRPTIDDFAAAAEKPKKTAKKTTKRKTKKQEDADGNL